MTVNKNFYDIHFFKEDSFVSSFKEKLTSHENNWINGVLEEINKQKDSNKLELNLSTHIQQLNSFEPESIINLVQIVHESLAQRKDYQSVNTFLATQSVRVIKDKGLNLFHHFLCSHVKEHSWLAVEVVIDEIKRGGDPLKMIQDYKISYQDTTSEGQKALIEIAKLAAQKNAWKVSQHIQNYGIDKSTPEGQKGLIEIAKLAAQQSGWITSECIQNYGIDKTTQEGQKALIEIAKLAAQESGGGTSMNIQNYGIDKTTQEGQKALIEIAKLAAQQNGWVTSEWIQNYGIDKTTQEGQKALIEIAKLAAQNSGVGISECIQNYGIDKFQNGQEALIEIAKLAAQQNARGLTKNIHKYGIDKTTQKGQKGLIEIVKLIAQKDGSVASSYIQIYGIDKSTPEGQKGLIEIAKLSAQQEGSPLSQCIQNYGINKSTPEEQKTLIEIAKLDVQHNGGCTLYNISNYDIDKSTLEGQKNYEDLWNLAFIFTVRRLTAFSGENVTNAFWLYDQAKFPGDPKLTYSFVLGQDFLTLSSKLTMVNISDIADECLDCCEKKFGIRPDWLQKTLKKNNEPFIKERLLQEFIAVAALCSMRSDLIELFKNEQETLEVIFRQEPRLREDLFKELIYLSYSKNDESWKKLREAVADKKRHVPVHMQLPSLVLANILSKKEVSKEEEAAKTAEMSQEETVYVEVLKTLSLSEERDFFKKSINQKLLLETLLKIRNSTLKGDERAALIKMLFELPLKERMPAFRIVCDLLAFKAESYIRTINGKGLLGLKNALEELFRKQFQVDLDNFSECYEKTLGSWRKKELVITYGGKLNELSGHEKTQAHELFIDLLKMILDGSFHKKRYDIEKNPHLAEISGKYPVLFEQWKIEQKLEPEEIVFSTEKKEIPLGEQVARTLKHALVHNHLGEEQANLYPDLAACIGKWENLDESLSRVTSKLAGLSGRRLTEDELPIKNQGLIEKQLLELLKDLEQLKDKEELRKKLIDLSSRLPKENNAFYRDVEDVITLINKSVIKQAKYTVIETDNPNHISLMGTEVLNSCQNINGTVNLNKCLLGYFLDGKHRLTLVCDAEGKILARSVLRLLIDSKGQPVLFQEKMYAADGNPEYQQLLRKIALKKAASLKIPLVGSKSDFREEKTLYPHSLHAKEKPVPFEYVDAKGGIQPGPYEITDAIQLTNK